MANRDLKPENIVFEGFELESTLKIIDFGRSKIFERKTDMTDRVGTVKFIIFSVILLN
jgi:serine/threonine protein kinase